MSQFESPATGTGIDWADLKGALLIVDVREVVKDINTVHGTTDAVRADVTVVDGPHAGDEYTDTLIFPRALKAQTAPKVGKKVLGRLGQGEAKPGMNPPWRLADASEADYAAATQFLIANPAPAVSADESPF
jgi:hypothetical protein